MKVIECHGTDEVAKVYLAKNDKGNYIEFVESVQPPIPREEKWVLIISTLYGCPVDCKFCDAGGGYKGKVSYEEMLFQIDTLVESRYSDKKIPVKKFKIQFARMGEPAFNKDVLKLLGDFHDIYEAPGFMPSISTIAPEGTDRFFDELLEIKNEKYNGRFQLQFSLHSTSEEERNHLIPIKKWHFEKIAAYGNTFYREGDRKITLNFALSEDSEFNVDKLLKYFDPEKFLIKITPLNPTYKAKANGLKSYFKDFRNDRKLDELKGVGYDYILSIGELEENQIGSNCGQYVISHKNSENKMKEGYNYIK